MIESTMCSLSLDIQSQKIYSFDVCHHNEVVTLGKWPVARSLR